jgi:S-DNA-T family DNA segregation ATPase FtsK/SpoIIIE
MARPKSKRTSGDSDTTGVILSAQWAILRVVVVAAAIGLIAYFRTFLANIVFEPIGFSLVLWMIWVGVIGLLIWRRKWRPLLRRWNVFLGAVALTAAVWGILSLMFPAGFTIGDVRFDVVSLGGNAGLYMIGNQGVGVPPAVRLPLLVAAGLALAAPRQAFALLGLGGQAAKMGGLAVVAGISQILTRIAQAVSDLFRKYPPQRLAVAPFVAAVTALRRRQASKPKPSREVLPPEPIAIQGTLGGEPVGGTRVTAKRDPAPAETTPRPPKTVETWPEVDEARKGVLPEYTMLDDASAAMFVEADNEQRARLIEKALESYGVEAKVIQINPGPSVTQFGVEPGWDRKFRRVVERDQQGKIKLDKDGNPIETKEEVSRTRVKVERITSLANNLALALAVHSIRIEAPVPGKSLVGIEVPNSTTDIVLLRSVVESPTFKRVSTKSRLAIALGKGAAGEPLAADLAKMPHLLIAGTTGSGKTVFLNSIIVCLLMHNTPQDLRLLLIDPKRVELVQYDGVPHLISPVVKDVDKAVDSLRRITREMDNRYKEFAAVGVRNVEAYNRSPLITRRMPYLVVLVDELNQLMMSAAEVVEPAICRLAQLSRATGMHLIVATQRPSVDVVTGLIKANFPTRIAFTVPSIMDSRTILDTGGAEKLLGGGDMLYLPSDVATPKRLRGCFLSDQEIDRVVKFWMRPTESESPVSEDEVAKAFAALPADESHDDDPMLASARRLAKETAHISTSLLQRRLHVGYPRAARIMDSLEKEGLVSRGDGGYPTEANEQDAEEE